MSQRLNVVIEFLCGILSAAALFAIMALTFFDVIGRKFASHSIPGSLELTELLMVVVIFAALPMVSKRGEHVEFDSLDPYLPQIVRQVLHVVVHLFAGTLLLGIAWIMWRAGMEFAASGETSVQLGIPKSPFIFGISMLCAATGIVHFVLVALPEVHKDETTGVAL